MPLCDAGCGVQVCAHPLAKAQLTITGGKGADTIILGAAVETVTAASDAQDTIIGFTTTKDKINVDGVTADSNITTVGATSGSVTAGALTNESVIVISDGATALTSGGTQSIADYTDLADVAAYLAEGFNGTTTGDQAVFVINDLVADKAFGYLFTDAATSGIEEGELTLIFNVSEAAESPLVAGDIL